METKFVADHVVALDLNANGAALQIGNNPATSGDVVIGQPDSTCTVSSLLKCRRASFASLNTGLLRINNSFDMPTFVGTVGQSLVSNGTDVVFQTIQTASGIQAPDTSSSVECSDGGSVAITSNSVPIFTTTSDENTQIFSPDGNTMIELQKYNAIGIYTGPNYTRQVFHAGGEFGVARISCPEGGASIQIAGTSPEVSYWQSSVGIDLIPDAVHGVKISGYRMPTAPGPATHVMTSNGTNVDWQPPPTVVFTQTFGGTVTMSDYFAVNGLSTTPGSSSSDPTIGFRYAVPIDCTLTRVSFDADSTLSNSGIDLYKGNAYQHRVSPVAGFGSLLVEPIDFNAGECVAVRRVDAGDLSVATLTCFFAVR